MATFIQDLTLQAMAEDLAYLGKQDPKLTLCPLGVINAYSKDNLATPQVQIDLRQHLAAAWPVLLDQLRERNIPIPQQLATPHFFGMSETVCVTTTRKALEVSAWMVDLGSYTFAKREGATSDIHYFRNDGFANTIKAAFKTNTDPSNIMLVGYKTIAGTYIGNKGYDQMNDVIGFSAVGNLYIQSLKFDAMSAAEFKTAMQGQYLIYQLADPIRIQYSDLGLPDINSGMIGITTDHILTLSDTDGLEMHRLQPVEWTDPEGNTHPALITRYSQAYMDKHQAWPPALPMTYTGLQFTADYKEMRWLHDTVLKLITKYPV